MDIVNPCGNGQHIYPMNKRGGTRGILCEYTRLLYEQRRSALHSIDWHYSHTLRSCSKLSIR